MKLLQLFGGGVALVVALTGCQRNASQADLKQGAQRAASQAGAQLADGWLTTKIESKYIADRDLKASDIKVSSHDGLVTLSGTVLNEPMRSLAVTVAQNTDGVKQVVNNLSVSVAAPVAHQQANSVAQNANGVPPSAVATSGTADTAASGATDNDGRITAAIQSKYFLDDKIKGRQINVQSSNGVVTLNGDVRDEVERGEALLLARTTAGVQRVEDNLSVTNDAATVGTSGSAQPVAVDDGDAALVSALTSRLSSDPQVGKTAIEISAKNGVVLLQGPVASAAAKQRALSLARSTDGVTQVVDRLRIGRAAR
jgi:hyperosmotically inducible protein